MRKSLSKTQMAWMFSFKSLAALGNIYRDENVRAYFPSKEVGDVVDLMKRREETIRGIGRFAIDCVCGFGDWNEVNTFEANLSILRKKGIKIDERRAYRYYESLLIQDSNLRNINFQLKELSDKLGSYLI